MLSLLMMLTLSQVFSPPAEGTLIVINRGEGTASLIDLKTNKAVHVLQVGEAPLEAVTNPEGSLVAISNYGVEEPGSTITVLDMRVAKVTKTLSLGDYKRPRGLYWLDRDRLLVTSETNQSLVVLNVASEKIEKVYRIPQQVNRMVVTTPDRRYAFTANVGSGTVSVIDLVEGRYVKAIPTGSAPEGIDVSPNGQEVWVANRGADTLSVIEVRSLRVVQNIECRSIPVRVKFTPDGHLALVTNARSKDLAIFDARNKREIRRIPLKAESPTGLLPHPRGGWAYVALSDANTVAVVDLLNGKVSAFLPAGKAPHGLAFSPLSALPSEGPPSPALRTNRPKR